MCFFTVDFFVAKSYLYVIQFLTIQPSCTTLSRHFLKAITSND